jgi:hypothetical protein
VSRLKGWKPAEFSAYSNASSRCEKALSLAAIEAIDGNWHQWLVEAERSRDAARR